MMTGTSWRDTLFVWDGIMMVEGDEKVKWSGTWVGVENCPDATKAEAPKRGAFDELVTSDMLFEVQGMAESVDDGTLRVTLVDGEGWDLKEDGSEETKKHKDHAHELFLKNLRWTGDLRHATTNLIFATGNNEFGSFISAGWMRPGNRLTLGRRYLDEGDARAQWTMDDLRKAVLDEICQEGEKARIPPWQCAALHSEDQSGK